MYVTCLKAARSSHNGSIRRIVNFSGELLTQSARLYLSSNSFFHQASLDTAFYMEIILLLKKSRPVLHTVSLADPSRKSFSTKETGSKGQKVLGKGRLIPITAAIMSELDADICESLKCSCPIKHQGMQFFHTEHSFSFCFSDGINQIPRFK